MFLWIYIFPSILISPFMSISMNSWFSIWMSLEFNLMMFIPLMIYLNKFFKETAMKYFIIQSISSSILIFSINMNLIMFYNFNMNLLISNILLNCSLLIKIGTAPFHFWFINLMNNLNWLNCLILSTWQKIAPLTLIMYNFNEFIIYTTMILSSIISSIYGLNHQSIRLIMSYSSINHISWMMMNFMISETMWILYFLSYFMINFSIMMMMYLFNIFFINQLNILNKNFISKILILMNFLSISGLPPMFGFLMKWMSLNFFILNNNILILMILLMSSLLSFFFYSRITLSIILIFNVKNKYLLSNYFYNIKTNSLNFIIFMINMNLWILNLWLL